MKTQIQMQGGHVKTEAEIGVMLPQAKDVWGFWKPEETRKDPPLDTSEGTRLCQHLNFELVASRTMREYIFLVLSHTICGTLLQQP